MLFGISRGAVSFDGDVRKSAFSVWAYSVGVLPVVFALPVSCGLLRCPAAKGSLERVFTKQRKNGIVAEASGCAARRQCASCSDQTKRTAIFWRHTIFTRAAGSGATTATAATANRNQHAKFSSVQATAISSSGFYSATARCPNASAAVELHNDSA